MGARLAILAGAFLLFACGPADRAELNTVAWIVVDTLRADALGTYGFDELGESGAQASPHIDRLAGEALVFDRAYSAAPWTIPSLVTQLSGTWPFDHGQSRMLEPLDESLLLLPEVLREAGWRTAGVTTNFIARASHGFDRGFERFDDGLAKGHLGAYGKLAVERLLAQGDALLAESEKAGEPDDELFLWGLLFEPHYHYERHPGLGFGPGYGSRSTETYTGQLSGEEEIFALRIGLREGLLDQADFDFLRGCYQSEVALVDEAIARLREGLEDRGRWDEALVIVTSDHGELIGENNWIGHTVELSETLVRVPLVVKSPASWGVPARRVPQAVSHVDLFATVLDAAGVRLPEYAAPTSQSLLPTWLTGEEPARRFLFLHTDFVPLREGEEFASKRALRFGVLDRERDVKWVVDHLATTPEGEPVVRGELTRMASGEQREYLGERLPPEYADLERLRGLLAEPLGDASGSERLELERP